MNRTKKIALIVGILTALLLAGIVGFMVVGDSGSGSSDSGSSVIWIIMVSQIPIWISLIAARQDERKKKNEDKLKNDDFLNDEDYYEDKMLSSYDGEIVAYDEPEEQQMMSRR